MNIRGVCRNIWRVNRHSPKRSANTGGVGLNIRYMVAIVIQIFSWRKGSMQELAQARIVGRKALAIFDSRHGLRRRIQCIRSMYQAPEDAK